MRSGKEAHPRRGSASELRHFLGAEEGIKASCMLTSAASYTPDLVYTCLPRSRDTLGSCSTSFNGRVQQGCCGSDHHSLVLSVFYLPTRVPVSSSSASKKALRLSSVTPKCIYSSLLGSLSVYNLPEEPWEKGRWES